MEFVKSISPTRDVPIDYKAFKEFRVQGNSSKQIVGLLESEPSPCRTSCTELRPYCNEMDFPVYIPDAFGNEVYLFGTYGADPRQIYYVYPPTGTPNGEVVVLVHGGGWFMGPNPDEVVGFGLNFSTNGSVSLVGDLLAEGFTVVSVLYRLAKVGHNQTDIESNMIAGKNPIDRIMDDIDGAINHFIDKSEECYETT
jgi:acetyl esterase/lipase